MPDIDALKIKSFIGTLRGTAFDWYKQLPENSITPWVVLEEKFLLHFKEEDQPVSLNSLTQSKQRENESVQGFINRWNALHMDVKNPYLSEINSRHVQSQCQT